MTRPLRIHIPGLLYHVFSRGNDKAPLFRNNADYELFLRLLAQILPRFDIECVAYCLMGNHDHLLVRVNEEPVSRLMQQLNSSYCQQFNRRHGHAGPVLQGRFGCKVVGDGTYVRTVIRYLALNPVLAEFCGDPRSWPWSSYRFACGIGDPPVFLALDRVWEAFGTRDPSVGRERLVHFVSAGVEDVFLNPLVHGSDAVGKRVEPLLDPLAFHREYASRQRFALRPSLGDLLAGRFAQTEIEDAALEAFDRYAYTLAELATALGRAPSTVWRWIQRARTRRPPIKGRRRRRQSSAEDIRGKIKT